MKRDFIPFHQMAENQQIEHLNRMHWAPLFELRFMSWNARTNFHRGDHIAPISLMQKHTHNKKPPTRGFADPKGLVQD